MKEIKIVSGTSFSRIKIVKDSIFSIFEKIPKDTIIITDSNLQNSYSELLAGKKLIVLAPGEQSKNLETMDEIYEKLISYNADRHSFLVGFGGGVVTDITGFIASTYMRGLQCGFLPTSLLGMIDASIGGKNGVNHRYLKNIIGTFYQPNFVLINHRFLDTLHEEEYKNGLAEAIKHFLIADKSGFDNFNSNLELFEKYNKNNAYEFIGKQVNIKSSIVNMDVKESGERKKLNFGHTFGHAIEKIKKTKHGYAVSIGMVIASKLSLKMGNLKQIEFDKIVSTLQAIGLPTEHNIASNELFDVLIKDKKKQGDKVHFVALKQIGNAQIIPIKISELKTLYDSVY